MTRREFLKKVYVLVLGLVTLYITRIFGLFKNHTATAPKHLAKYFHQANDLAG